MNNSTNWHTPPITVATANRANVANSESHNSNFSSFSSRTPPIFENDYDTFLEQAAMIKAAISANTANEESCKSAEIEHVVHDHVLRISMAYSSNRLFRHA